MPPMPPKAPASPDLVEAGRGRALGEPRGGGTGLAVIMPRAAAKRLVAPWAPPTTRLSIFRPELRERIAASSRSCRAVAQRTSTS